VYQIKATEGVQVLIPPNLVGELKGLPEDVLSQSAATREVRAIAKYRAQGKTGLTWKSGNDEPIHKTLFRES
jgi:hypothetical protein